MTAETDPLDALQAADEARTPGPWRSRVSSTTVCQTGDTRRIPIVSAGTDDNTVAIVDSDFDHEQATADFIALCGTHVPTLLSRLRAAEAERGALRDRAALLVRRWDARDRMINDDIWESEAAIPVYKQIARAETALRDALAKYREVAG